MKRTRLLLAFGICLTLAGTAHAAIPLQWQVNPPEPCTADEVAVVFRAYRPWSREDNPFYYAYRDSFVAVDRVGSSAIVVRTVFREAKTKDPDGSYLGAPARLGRLPVGSHSFVIRHHQIVEHADGSLDSTITESPLDLAVAGECPAILTPTLPYEKFVQVSPAEPCVWRPLSVTIGGLFPMGPDRVLSSTVADSSHASLVVLAGSSGTTNTPPWSTRFDLGLPGPGIHSVDIMMTVNRLNGWPPRPGVRYKKVLEIPVAATCGSLPAPSALPYNVSVAAGRGQDCVVDGTVQPGNPILVSLSGFFPDGCHQIRRVDLLPSPFAGSTPEPPVVRVVVDRGGCDEVSCIEMLTPWCASAALPALPAGKYGLVTQVAHEECNVIGPDPDVVSMPVLLTVTSNPQSPQLGEDGPGTVGVDPPAATARGPAVSSSRPNPFSEVARFTVTMSESGPLRVSIHDLHGRQVAELYRGEKPPGTHEFSWDGTVAGWTGGSGIYFYRVTSRSGSASGKVVLMRPPR